MVSSRFGRQRTEGPRLSPRRLASISIVVGSRAGVGIEATRSNSLVSTDVDPGAVAENIAARAERVGLNVHHSELVRRVVVLGSPCGVSTDRDGVAVRRGDPDQRLVRENSASRKGLRARST